MKNNLLKIITYLAIAISSFTTFIAPAYAASGTCKIARISTDAPITWDNGDSMLNTEQSVFNTESCNVPANSVITNMDVTFTAYIKRPLYNSLPWATYTLTVQGNSIVDEVSRSVSSSVISVGYSRSLTNFHNQNLNGLNFSISAIASNTNIGNGSLSCQHPSDSSICENFLTFEYTLDIDYEYPTPTSYKNLTNRKQGLCLDVQGYNGAARDNVMLYSCDGYPDQQWDLPAVGQWGVIRNKKQALCLDVQGYNGAARDNVMLFNCDGYPDQQWKLLSSGKIINKTNGLCLDVQGYNGAIRDNVMLFNCDGYPDQEWD